MMADRMTSVGVSDLLLESASVVELLGFDPALQALLVPADFTGSHEQILQLSQLLNYFRTPWTLL
jgi:hypothetical protein